MRVKSVITGVIIRSTDFTPSRVEQRFLHQITPKNYRMQGLLGYLGQVNNDI